MSPAARSLPRTRTFQRRRHWSAWWTAVGIAVVVNLALVVVLSQISNLQHAPAEPPQAVHRLRQVEPDPPPPSTPEVPQPLPTPVDEPIAIALPTLDLPAMPTPQALALPYLPNLDATLALPMGVPAFTAIGAKDPGPEANLWPGPGQPDESAQLESSFDLERFYPRSARLRGVSGRTMVRLTITEDGQVLTAHVYESTPSGVFDQATRELARSLRFRPGRLAGKPVASTKDLIIDWTMK